LIKASLNFSWRKRIITGKNIYASYTKHYKEYSDLERYYFDWKYRQITKTKMAVCLNISRPTLNKLLRQYQEQQKYQNQLSSNKSA